jgi:hypothetical protein
MNTFPFQERKSLLALAPPFVFRPSPIIPGTTVDVSPMDVRQKSQWQKKKTLEN